MNGGLWNSKLIKNTILNALGLAIPIFVATLCIPPIFAALGKEASGLLLVIWAIVNSSALLDFGLGRALTFHIANSLSTNLIGPAFLTAFMIGLLLGASLYLGADLTATELGTRGGASVFRAIAWSIPFIISTSVLRGALEARRKFALVNAIRIPTGSLNFLAPLAVVWLASPDNTMIAWSLTGGRCLTFLIFAYFTAREFGYKFINISDLTGMRRLLGAGGWMTISNMAGPVMSLIERFVIGSQLSLASVTAYATPQEFVGRLAIAPNALSIALFPELANGSLGAAALGQIYSKCLLAILALSAPLCLTLFLFAKEILSLWLGPQFADSSATFLQVFTVGAFVGGLAQIPFVLIQARGGARHTGILHLLEVLIFAAILLVAVSRWGTSGAAIVWIGRVILDAAVLFSRADGYATLALTTDIKRGLRLLCLSAIGAFFVWFEPIWPRVVAALIVGAASLLCAIDLLKSKPAHRP